MYVCTKGGPKLYKEPPEAPSETVMRLTQLCYLQKVKLLKRRRPFCYKL